VEEERKTKLYDSNSEFITYANKNGFTHSPYHYAKRFYDFGCIIIDRTKLEKYDFKKQFDQLVLSGLFTPIKKDDVLTIPEKERRYFEKFYLMLFKSAVIGTLDREGINYFKNKFYHIMILMEEGQYDSARSEMGHCLMQIQLSRKIEGITLK
jgi:hypothetical protein